MVGLIYAACSYLAFVGTFLYAFGFIEGWAVPKTVDSGAAGPVWLALAIDAGWFVAFALQHSGMARASFKRGWTRVVPEQLERSTYVVVSSLFIAALFVVWRPLPQVIWRADSQGVRLAMYALSGVGWLVLLVSTFLYDHFELFGLKQPWMRWRGRQPVPARFRTPGLYRWVRHPMYVGFLIAFWASPDLTVGHALFAGGFSLYLMVGIYFEERDLTRTFGEEYLAYRRRVPMLLPWWPR
jgi:protein-S-isoprenylcysteine O-methyltransferase Ste14